MNTTTNAACFAYNLRTRTESLKPCIQLFVPIKKGIFGAYSFSEQVAAKGNFIEAT